MTPKSNRIPFNAAHVISQETINFVINKVWDCTDSIWPAREISDKEATNEGKANNFQDIDIGHFCAVVVRSDIGETITQYKKLVNDPNPILINTWNTSFGKGVGRLAQGDTKTKEKRTAYLQ